MKKLAVLLSLMISFFSWSQTWNWVDRVAGNGNNYVFAVEADEEAQMVYSTGRVKGTGFFGEISTPVNTIQYGDRDVFLTKHDIDGNLIWVKRFGGSLTDYGQSIELFENYIYVTGYFMDTVVIDNTDTLVSIGLEDVFICKFTNDGDLVWSKTYGGQGNDQTMASEITPEGDIYIVGTFEDSISFDGIPLENTINPVTFPFTTAAFITKLDENGNTLWSRKQQSTRDVVHNDIVLKDGFIYIAGIYNGVAEFFPGVTLIMNTGYWQSSLMKVSESGSLAWVEGYGGSNTDILSSIHFDDHNNIFGCGAYRATTSYQSEVLTSPPSYGYNGMIIKFDTSGTVLNSVAFPETLDGRLDGLTIADDRVYVAGYFSDSLFINGDTVLSNGLYDILLVGLDTGLNYLWSSYQGGTSYDQIRNIDAFEDHTIVFGGSIKNTVVFPTITFTTLINTYDGIMGTVTPPMEAFVAESDTAFCTGSLITIYNTSIGHEDTAIWGSDGLTIVSFDNDSLVLLANSPGVYQIELLVSNLTETDSVLSKNISVYESATLDLGADTVAVCIGDLAKLTAIGNYDNLLWSTTESTDTIYATTTGWYYAESSLLGNCPFSDSVFANINLVTPVIDILEDTIIGCLGSDAELNATGLFDSILWSNSETNPVILVSTPGWYVAEATMSAQCLKSDSVFVVFEPAASVDLGADTVSACIASSIQLTATGAFDEVFWSTFQITPSIDVTSSGWYFVEASLSNLCFSSDSIFVDFSLLLPSIELGTDSLKECIGSSVELIASGIFDHLEWSTAETTNTILVNSTGWVSAAAFSPDDCILSDSVFVEFVDCLSLSEEEIRTISLFHNGQLVVIVVDSDVHQYAVYDMSGRIIGEGKVIDHQIDFNQNIVPGQYVIIFDNLRRSKFIILN